MPTLEFLNVDLEIVSEKEPKVLLREFGRKVIVLYSGESNDGYLVALELARYRPDAIRTLRKWITVLQRLSPNARREWRAAKTRKLDAGFKAIHDTGCSRIELPTDLLKAIASLGASYVVTLYSSDLPPIEARKIKTKR